MKEGLTFEQALRTREFEDDKPNFTPRISGIIRRESEGMNFAMSILKSAEGDDSSCERFTYAYSNPIAGKAKFIHTYNSDGDPLPSFEGEPKTLELPDVSIDELTDLIWTNLNEDNKVSLFVRYIVKDNISEGAVVEGIECIGISTLIELCQILEGKIAYSITPHTIVTEEVVVDEYLEDFADVKGQYLVKRALEIAAAGGHNVIMVGAPGSGKTMLARRMPSILPPMTTEEALETTKIHSVAGKIGTNKGLITQRPFRAPHHLTSQVALIGGGQSPQPGEVSLANNGVLFLDEMPEFGRNVLEVLRQPLEDRHITISRAKYSVDYPARFTLIASMNPCPCGYYNHPTKECTCSAAAVHRYMSHISGPLMDRIDIHIEVVPVSISEMTSEERAESSAEVRKRVVAARNIQLRRFEGLDIHCNAMMNSSMLRKFAPLDRACSELLELAMARLNLSARAYDRIIKVARTIADLEAKPNIEPQHISEAIGYRSLDRENWGR